MSKLFFLLATLLVTAELHAELTPTRYLHFNGVKIAAYESDGTREPTILMIHGNTSSANSYEKIMESSYARHQHIVAIDLPGYGKSDNAPSYNIGYFAQAIKFAAKKFNADHGVIVGWSLGGDLTLQASTILPHVKGYFLFGTAPFGVDPSLPPPFLTAEQSYAGPAVSYGFIADLTEQQIHDYVTAFFRPGYNHIVPAFFTDGLRTDPATRGAVATAGGGMDPTFQDEVAIVRAMTKPLALIVGENDAFLNKDFMNALAPSIPNLFRDKIIYVNTSGHAVQWEKPDRFINLLDHFVSHL